MESGSRVEKIDLSAFEQGAKAYLDNPAKVKDWLESILFEPNTVEHDQFIEGVAAAEHGNLDARTQERLEMSKEV